MKPNTTQPLKTGNFKAIFFICFALTIIYIISTFLFFLNNSIINPTGLRAINKPFFLYLIKWFYALMIMYGTFIINKKNKTGWIILNIASINILLLRLEYEYLCPTFYMNLIDVSLLELLSLFLLIFLNLKIVLNKFKTFRVKYIYLFISIISIIFALITYWILENIQYSYVWYGGWLW